MSYTQQSLLWAAAIIAFGLFGAFGPIENEFARNMLWLLPVLGWSIFGQQRSCLPCPVTRNGDAR